MQDSVLPQDQLDRVRASVEALRDVIRPLLKDLPFDSESALTFHPGVEEPR